MKTALKILGVLVVAGVAGGALTTDYFASLGDLSPEVPPSPHFRDGKWRNDQPVNADLKNPGDTLREWFRDDVERAPAKPLPVYAKTLEDLAVPPETGLRITWFGHSSSLIEIDGVRVLTDPHWSERCSPSQRVGPRRFHPVAIPLEKLGPVDAVAISHDHYDHLDMATVKALAATGTRFLVALGVGSHLRKWGVPEPQIVEHDWWKETALRDGVKAVSTPAQHFSGRFLSRDNTFWTSWTFVGPKHRVFHSGDTGLSTHFEEIAEKLGPFDVTMLEIGQYHPSWGTIHLGPHGALRAHGMLRGKHLLPIHWATFELGLHAWDEPPETLVTIAKDDADVVTPMIGEPVEPTRPRERTRWWRSVAR